jgi:hypothetical protein
MCYCRRRHSSLACHIGRLSFRTLHSVQHMSPACIHSWFGFHLGGSEAPLWNTICILPTHQQIPQGTECTVSDRYWVVCQRHTADNWLGRRTQVSLMAETRCHRMRCTMRAAGSRHQCRRTPCRRQGMDQQQQPVYRYIPRWHRSCRNSTVRLDEATHD